MLAGRADRLGGEQGRSLARTAWWMATRGNRVGDCAER